MFQVRFYTINKRKNSTALPPAAYSSFNCQAKSPLSIQSPVILLEFSDGAEHNPVSFNYAYIPTFNRYYWVNDWVNTGVLWEAKLSVDVLASFRSAIMSHTTFVLRAAADYNPQLPDSVYPATVEKTLDKININTPWVGIPDEIVDGTPTGFYSVGIASEGFVKYYGMLRTTLEALLSYILSDAYATAAIGDLQLAMYPETKIALNPMQYITSITYIPFIGPYANGTNVTGIKIGSVTVNLTAREFTTDSCRAILMIDRNLDTHNHPDALTRGLWLDMAPWTTFELFFPPFGLIPLDSAILGRATKLSLMIVVDCRTGAGTMSVYAVYSASSEVMIAQVDGQIGIDIPVSGIATRPSGGIAVSLGAFQGVTSGITAAAAGNVAGSVGAFASAVDAVVGDAVQASIPHLSVIGSQGSASKLSGQPALNITYTGICGENNAEIGRPLCESVTLSTLSPGFVLCSGSDLPINGTANEQQMVNDFLNGGVFLA